MKDGGIYDMKEKTENTRCRRPVAFRLLSLMTAVLVWSGSILPAASRTLLAADSLTAAAVRQYTFQEVGDLAENNSHDIIKQEADLAKAELQQESARTSYQIAVFEYWYNGGDGDETSSAYSALYSLQNSFESAVTNAEDSETELEQLKPKVRFDAEKLYITLLMGGKEITLQEKNVEIAKTARDLEAIKLIFGNSTSAAVETAEQKAADEQKTLDTLKATQKTNEDSMRVYLGLAEGTAFTLAETPELGTYQTVFDAAEVQKYALENSLSLEQTQRSLDNLDEQIKEYDRMGKDEQSELLSISATGTELSYEEAVESLKSKVAENLDQLMDAKAALEAAKTKTRRADIDYLASKLKYDMGSLSRNELQTAEKSKVQAANAYAEAQYDVYFAAQQITLMYQGILVS
jgi:outer membrane protein TolC